MNNLIRIFRFELVQQAKRRAYLFATFVLPVLAIVAVFAFQAYQDIQASRQADEPPQDEQTQAVEEFGKIGYVDHSGLFVSPGLFGTVLEVYEDEEAALAALEAGDLSTVYVIEPDYVENGTVTRYVETVSLSGLSADDFFRSFLYATLMQGADRSLIQRMNSDLYIVEHQVADTGEVSIERDEDVSYWMAYALAMMLLFSTMFSGGYLMQSVVQEKETRMVEIMLATVRPVVLLAGKVLAAGLMGLVQIIIWGGAAFFIFSQLGNLVAVLAGVELQASLLFWGLLYFIGGYLMFAGAYAAVGAISQSMREGPQLVVVFTLPAVLPLYFINIITETPNATMPLVMSLFPVTAPVGMIMRLSATAVPVWQVLLSLALLFLGAVGTFWLAGRLFRVNTLLAGQMPRWRDLITLVREN